jgi:competence protein ComEC
MGLLVPLVGLILGLTSVYTLPAAAAVLAGAIGSIAFRRRWRDLFLLCAFAAFGWLRGSCAAEKKIPWKFVGAECEMAMRIERCTARNYGSWRRINGFAKLEKIGDGDGQFGQSIYYNLRLDNGVAVPLRGQLLLARASIRPTAKGKVPFERYLRESGIQYRVGRGKATAVESGSAVDEFLAKLLSKCGSALGRSMDADSKASHIYGAMLLGKRDGLSAREKNCYSRAGVAHLFAISGLHIGIIAAFLAAATGWTSMAPPSLFALRAFLLLLFVAMTGSSPSSIRAFLMVSSIWAAPLFFRRSRSLQALALAAILTLSAKPAALLNTGFQFSYGVVFAILTYGIPLSRQLRKALFPERQLFQKEESRSRLRSIGASCVDMVAISFSTTIPLIPLSLYHFQIFSIGGILLNPLIIPVAEIAILLGFCSICCGFFGIFIGCHLLNILAKPFLWVIVALCGAVGNVPWLQSGNFTLGTAQLLLWISVIFLTLSRALQDGGKSAWRLVAPVAAAILPLPLL